MSGTPGLVARAGARVEQARRFVRDDLWSAEPPHRSWPARGLQLLRFVFMVGEGFVRDRLLLRASALTYFTVLSIVPLLAIVGSVVTALGVTENVVAPLLDRIASVAPDVGTALRERIQNANIAGLGTLGAVALFLTTVFGISNIERALNHVWGVKQDRSWSRKLADYLAVLIVAPLLLGAGLSLATTVKSQWVVQQLLQFPAFELLYHLGLSQLPTLVLVGAFGFLYWFLPNTSVRPVAALLGALVAAVGVNAGLGLYVGASVGAARANALYGGFAQIPLLFVWIYFFWAIVLLGAEIAFAYQNLEFYRREVHGRRPGPAERDAIGLCIALEVARAFRDAQPPLTDEAMADALRTPVRSVRDVLAALEEGGVVAPRGGGDRGAAFQLGRPAEAILVADVLGALRGPREPVTGDPQVRKAVEGVLEELEEGAAKGAAGRTLAELLAGLPSAESETR